MGTRHLPVHVMPDMAEFLSQNGPWSQLVRYENILLQPMEHGRPVRLNSRLSITPFDVPHRQEYSEVAGFRIEGPSRRILFIPDIDSWEDWDVRGVRIEEQLRDVDIAYLDATFYAHGEISGRDMSGFPHPFISHTMERLSPLPKSEKKKVRFIHLNHTNPVLLEGSPERRDVEDAGFRVANELERVFLE